ncbi:hypothetical protein [Oscillatoria acuminata]|uniref:hypothetical protein n=1 Tax=Oscillatoria acuminata TaxID=118323 RepID=UPI0002DBFAEB|nr:hypothetical protein [Oscillatoria acuminata]
MRDRQALMGTEPLLAFPGILRGDRWEVADLRGVKMGRFDRTLTFLHKLWTDFTFIGKNFRIFAEMPDFKPEEFRKTTLVAASILRHTKTRLNLLTNS